MMGAATYNFTIERGATFQTTFTCRDSAGALIDLTGYSARMQIRQHRRSAEKFVDLTQASGLTLGGALGTIAVVISDTVTAALLISSGVYDLEIESGSGVTTRIVEGEVTVSGEVTR
jgi:hypothetical protein